MGTKHISGAGTEPPAVLGIYRDLNEALMIGSVRQHELTEIAQRAEEALRTSEQRFRALFDLGPVGIYSCDTSGRVKEFNRRAVELWGREPSRGQGSARYCGSFKMFRPDGALLPHSQSPMATVLNGGVSTVRDAEVVMERPDGSQITVVANIIRLQNDQGETTGAIECFYDITGRKRGEAELKASEIRYRRLFEAAKDGILILDAETGTVDDVNPFLMELLGLAKIDLLGKKVWELGCFRNVIADREKFAQLQGTEYVRYDDVGLDTADGRAINVEFVSNIYEVNGGRVIQCNIRNITERKVSQESLRLFRALIDRSSDAIEVIDPQTGRFLDVNEKGCGDLGYSREEFLSLTVFDVNPRADESSFSELMYQLRDSISMVGNGVHQRKDGSTFPVEVSMKYVHLDRDYVVTVSRDITERIQTEEEHQNFAEQLRALAGRLHTAREDESLRLARAIHDDLGHALTRLNMEVVFLEESLAKDPMPRAEVFQRTAAMAKQVESAVIAVQRIATELRPGLLDDLGLAAALEWQAEEFATRTGICCRWKQEPDDVELPKEQSIVVYRIFQEILNNITRHAGAKTVDLDWTHKDGILALSIHDDGKGFDEGSLSPHASLGLLGMRERALLIGGEIKIESAPGRGTTVSVITPMGATELPKPAKIARDRKT